MKGIFINAEGKKNLEDLIEEFQKKSDGQCSLCEQVEYESAIESYEYILSVATLIP